jgi:glycosyltransferase involved in cell wall biosynthesis
MNARVARHEIFAKAVPISSPRPQLRVHQVINHFGLDRGGAERLVRQLHADLMAAGVDSRLVALEDCPTAGLPRAVSLGGRGAYDPRILPRLAAYARAEIAPGDLVHAHLFPSSAYVGTLVRLGLVKVPCLFTEHSTSNKRRVRPLGRGLDRLVYARYARIVAISDGVEHALRAAYPGLAGRTTTILNGCELRFAEVPERRADGRVPTILSIGRLTRPKNYPAALEALARLGSRPFRYVVLGDGEERAQLTEQARRLGLADRVSFEGHRADVRPYLAAADILLLPSLWEGFGLAAVEAMNAGLPVVASDVAGLREVVGPSGDCGRLVDPADVAAIAEALAGLIDSPETRAAMGRRGFERARRFDKAEMTKAYLALYDALARGDAADA